MLGEAGASGSHGVNGLRRKGEAGQGRAQSGAEGTEETSKGGGMQMMEQRRGARGFEAAAAAEAGGKAPPKTPAIGRPLGNSRESRDRLRRWPPCCHCLYCGASLLSEAQREAPLSATVWAGGHLGAAAALRKRTHARCNGLPPETDAASTPLAPCCCRNLCRDTLAGC